MDGSFLACFQSFCALVGQKLSRIFCYLKASFASYMKINSSTRDFCQMQFLPLYFDLRRGKIALVGAGNAAESKLRLLLSAGASVLWYGRNAESVNAEPADETATNAPDGRLVITQADPRDADFSQFIAVVSAAGDALDDEIAAKARTHNLPVNVVDRPDLSTFIFPAIIDRGDVVVAVGTGGAAPVLARRLRERIEALLPARIGDLAALLRRFRPAAKARHSATSLRRFWERVVDGPIGAAALAGRWHDAEVGLARAVTRSDDDAAPAGTVYLVGAGPGDPDLLTLRALQALQSADIVFYDELVAPEILDRARRDAERVGVGRRSGLSGIGQDAINAELARAARLGLNVVRLKGGDPFIFGRGGEELDYLREQGIEVVVVPGVTAAIGCAAEARLPLTFRNEATELAFVSAQHAGAENEVDWSRYADAKITLVVYMGLAKAAQVRDGLIAAGRDADTPAAVLVRGTRADAKALVGRLDQIVVLASQAGDGPALLVVGQGVAHSDAWRDADDALAALAEFAA
jgi:uroporphyrin-III C-methyltransferase / precorrin-2 dehydrogenase / sirohydrochlorin ferrochelatase